MNNEMREFLQEMVNKSSDELFEIADGATINLYNNLLKYYSKDDAYNCLIEVFAVYVACDKKVSRIEHQLVNKSLSIDSSYDSFYDMVCEVYNNESIQFVIDLCGINSEIKKLIIFLGITIFSIDGSITPEELRLLERIQLGY